ncbi:MAG: aldolase/citrate lyase family protein [Nocardioides sp.]
MTDADKLSARLADRLAAELDERLAEADAQLAARYPGERAGRQPVHTAYVPADRFTAGIARSWGDEALALLDQHADKFATVVADADIIRRVKAKLSDEPVEDVRVDFEDGYVGFDSDAEDEHVRTSAHALAEAQQDGTAAPYAGIRIKSFDPSSRTRGVRTLTRFLATYAEARGSLDAFVVTLPKVTSTEQVAAFVHAAATIEDELGLAEKAIRFEVQVETPQTILGADGTALVARIVHASDGRLTGLHYGTYDYSAYLGIAAGQQSLEHPAADHAKLVMQAAAAGTGVRLSDGSTNVLPVGDSETIHLAWENHHRLVTRALERGFYQGWDLHPGHLPTRYAATYAFFRGGLPRALERLKAYAEQRKAGAIADEPATARALADYVLRGLDCGAVDAGEVTVGCGLDEARLRGLARR